MAARFLRIRGRGFSIISWVPSDIFEDSFSEDMFWFESEAEGGADTSVYLLSTCPIIDLSSAAVD